ncbi:MAG: acetylhydrolase [Firmicutes bacterium]|nr:acetylhydrolase [Bacillota bacterium]
MNRLIRLPIAFWVLLLALLFAAKLALAEPYKAEAGPYDVSTFLVDLQDEQRDRTVPIKVYIPLQSVGPRPTVLVSHGLGGTREGLSYLGNHWASHGYLCIHMQHAGSDDSVWRDVPAKDRLRAMRQAAGTPSVAIDRAKDVPFVLDQLTQLNQQEGSKFNSLIDIEKVAIAGHSFGAWSTMAAGGMTVGGKLGKSYGDERIKCIIPLSPPVAKKRQRKATYSSLDVPALFMTGTLDTSMINSTTAEERLIPYQIMPGVSEGGAPKYQINFDGADHMTFSGETRRRLRGKVPLEDNKAFHSIILQSTTAFLDGHLLGDEDAVKWLNEGGFVELVGERGEVEMDTR